MAAVFSSTTLRSLCFLGAPPEWIVSISFRFLSWGVLKHRENYATRCSIHPEINNILLPAFAWLVATAVDRVTSSLTNRCLIIKEKHLVCLYRNEKRSLVLQPLLNQQSVEWLNVVFRSSFFLWGGGIWFPIKYLTLCWNMKSNYRFHSWRPSSLAGRLYRPARRKCSARICHLWGGRISCKWRCSSWDRTAPSPCRWAAGMRILRELASANQGWEREFQSKRPSRSHDDELLKEEKNLNQSIMRFYNGI